MFRFCALLTCLLFIASAGSSQAAPLDSPGTVYIDRLPCNRACQSYMAWSRQVLRSLNSPQGRSQFAQPSSKTKTQRASKARRPGGAAPTRIAKQVAPKPMEPVSTNRDEAKANFANKADMTSPSSSSEVRTPPGNLATAPATEDIATSSTIPDQDKQPDGNPEISSPSVAATPPAESKTTALAPPSNADHADDQMIAILLVRPDIKSVSDLAKKIIAIDASRSDSVASVKSAIAEAGGSDVQISEDQSLALVRVMDGEVPAAVVALVSPEAAGAWDAGVKGFNILRIPLSIPSEKPGRG